MYLSRLRIRQFRNLAAQDIELPPRGVAIVGENAQGKSNFLEAVYYLETFRSFRGAPDERLVAFGAPGFHLRGTLRGSPGDPDLERGSADPESMRLAGEGDQARDRPGLRPGEAGQGEVSAAFQRHGRRKKIVWDGRELDRFSDGLGKVAAVIFSPADTELVAGPPAGRRRFLDVVLSLNRPGYLSELQRYRRYLEQRNAALRAGAGGGRVGAWNDGLATSGAQIIRSRVEWVRDIRARFGAVHRWIADGQEGTLDYVASIPLEAAKPEGDLREAFLEALRDTADQELRLGHTVVGPHRDDLDIGLTADAGSLRVREFGSGGQTRTAALSLRLVEAETVRRARARQPLLLMDDVLAELDPPRAFRVLALLADEHGGQVIVTAPKETDVTIGGERLPRWRIRDGLIDG